MKLLNFFKQSIRHADFFKSHDLLRYRAQSDYKTVFGGAVSILLIALLVITFYQRLFSCIKKDAINSTEEILIRGVPTPYNLQSYPKGNFMLAVNIRNFNQTQIQKNFQISMTQILSFWDYDKNQWNNTYEDIKLEPCTQNHWGLLGMTRKEYDSWDLDNMLCVPMNMTFKIEVNPCNSSNLNKSCATAQQVTDMFAEKKKIEARLYIINSNVNPSTKEHIHYNFNYRNLLTFTNNEGSQGTVFVQDYEIQTDESILPVSMIKTEIGATLSTNIIPSTHLRTNENSAYCQFNIFKSDVSKKYNRSFDKFDELLAYIGGLFGMLSMCLVIVSSYNNLSYQISLGAALFKPQELAEMRTFKKYNFLSYLLQMVYSLLLKLGLSPNWKSTIQYNKCQKQIEKQLDIKYILDRLTYFQTVTSTLLEDYQSKSLHLKGKLTLKQAKMRRRAFKIKRDIKEAQRIVQVRQNTDDKLTSTAKMEEITDLKMPDAKPSSPFSFFTNNMILPTHPQSQQFCNNVSSIDQHPAYESDTSSSEEEQTSQKEEDKKVINVINKLRRETERGDRISRRIWEITNPTLLNLIPELVTKISGGMANDILEATKASNSSQPKFADVIVEGISSEESSDFSDNNVANQSRNSLIVCNFNRPKSQKNPKPEVQENEARDPQIFQRNVGPFRNFMKFMQ